MSIRLSRPSFTWERDVDTYLKISLVISAIGVIVSVATLAHAFYQARFKTSIEMVLKLDERFSSEAFEQKRAEAASELLKQGNVSYAEVIYDFFETVGFLLHKKAIDKAIVWSTFYHWTHGYWSAGKSYIENKRQIERDKTLWTDFEYLHNELLKVERSTGNQSQPETMDLNAVNRFLTEESYLIA
jgi:hypothetical protein